MGTPGTTRRTDPLAVVHPVDVTEEIHAEMFEDWSFSPVKRTFRMPSFAIGTTQRFRGANLQMDYSLRESRKSKSLSRTLPSYDSALRSVRIVFGYTLTYSTPEQCDARRNRRIQTPVTDNLIGPLRSCWELSWAARFR
jgi:hypothetical protein